jgi:hypothetical protein
VKLMRENRACKAFTRRRKEPQALRVSTKFDALEGSIGLVRWQRRAPRSKDPLYHADPVGDTYLTAVFMAGGFEATRERLRLLVEYLVAALADREFEIIAFVRTGSDAHYRLGVLQKQFPEMVPILTPKPELSTQALVIASLKARGQYVVLADQIEAELGALPEPPDRGYLRFIDPRADLLHCGGCEALLFAAGAK